ncbi:tetratricopeptide repeat protein [Hyalangium rubrum]|uniref:Tetratricopeptide repeat protein n=1 Tax=Hyalangium rubrum TaxID=3103134 RepID=A0ABU5HH41_9BACT|nr:tetratricopeptide repeat protein [Hyalangium sp. s54d21]MDY7232774.1 tetratricopeptide repeat protein [Hyalangium sp. s54d21]
MKTARLSCALVALLPALSWAQAAPSQALRRTAPLSPVAQEGLQLAQQGCQSDGYEPELCERAIARLEEAAREDPEGVDVQVALAQAYWNRGQVESPQSRGRQSWRQRSVDTLQRMVDRKVKDARPYYELSLRQEEDAKRTPLLERTVELEPRHPRARQDMAWGLLRQGRADEALRAYKEHMEASPVKDRQEARENLRFADEMARRKGPRQAAQVLETVMKQTREERRSERCLLFQAVDPRLAESAPVVRGELQALRPYCTDTQHLDRAVELERQGRVDEAVTALEQQVATNPKPEETHVMLERLYERKGQVAKAAEATARELRAKPDVRELCERFRKVSPLTLRAMNKETVEAVRRQCREP